MAPQYRPDVFKGAVGFAGGGSGVIAASLGKSDAVRALKMLEPVGAARRLRLPGSGRRDVRAQLPAGRALNALVTQAP